MTRDVRAVLKKLNLEDTGKYENGFYIIQLADSNEYAKMYTLLTTNAINTEFPNFGKNTNNTTIKATNYFEVEADNITYNIFLIADFEKDNYYIKINEQ